jgi:hypothetical protein
MRAVLCILPLLIAVPSASWSQASDEASARKELAADLAELQQLLLQANAAQTVGMSDPLAPYKSGFDFRVTAPSSFVKAGASDNAASITKLAKGTNLMVVDKVDDWYAVRPKMGAGTAGHFDFGWMKASDGVPVYVDMPQTSRQQARDLFDKLVEKASEYRDKYANSEHYNVSGFALTLGIPPSMSINVEFKPKPRPQR